MKKATTWWAAALLVLPVILTLAGCSSTAGIEGSSAAMKDAEGNVQYSEYVVINNPKVARGLQIVELTSKFVGDLLMANIALVSKYSDTEEYQYQFSWFDGDGIALDPEAYTWIPFIMYGNESKTIQGVSPNPAARKFKINIRTR
ncbi:MAG: DUF1425 domain-containing protein [Candidatus Euphemobacter frigidus]|nr:DUF1425 domain-containing protein [Candidatus Euphemobacter frigidus]MDP8275423.1 DUF1425 domain-containing protein [Candidatus Euphemobacter frigidus]